MENKFQALDFNLASRVHDSKGEVYYFAFQQVSKDRAFTHSHKHTLKHVKWKRSVITPKGLKFKFFTCLVGFVVRMERNG